MGYIKGILIGIVIATCVSLFVVFLFWIKQKELEGYQKGRQETHIHTWNKWENTRTFLSDQAQLRYCSSCNIMEIHN